MFTNFKLKCLWVVLASLLASGCQQVNNLARPTVRPTSLRDVPAARIGFRFEPDVLPAPELEKPQPAPQKLAAVQADFDQNRPQDQLERTILSADNQRALAVYQSAAEEKGEFRLDLYEPGGKLIRKITTDTLALHFPDSIAWSPDSSSFVFAGARRVRPAASQEIVQEAPRPPSLENENQNGSQTAEQNSAPTAAPTAAASPVNNQPNVLTFRTEQIYLANRDGGELKILTQTDGLIYYRFFWSPDSAQLAALACKENDWNALQTKAQAQNEIFKPYGRPRLLEKSGRERRLDDGLTDVDLVWSPDGSKVATAFDKQVRIYDALGNSPSAAALPLQIPLLIAAKICDEKVAAQQTCVNADGAAQNLNDAANVPSEEPTTFTPIVSMKWTEDKTLYLQTGFVKDLTNGESVRSYMRWHRLNFSPQAAALN